MVVALFLCSSVQVPEENMRVKTLCVSLTMAAALGSPTTAMAHDPPTVAERAENSLTGFALHSVFGVALDNGALAMSVGGRYAWSNNWLVGIDAEYNPWFNLSSGRVARGVINTYATLIYRQPVSRHFSLRTSVHLGSSLLLFEMVGAPKGSIGPYLGASLLGLSYELAPKVYLIVDPADVVVPVPQVHGAPFLYRQYRFSIGVQWGA